MTITLQQAQSGKWRAAAEQGDTQTAVFGDSAEDAVKRLMRFRRGT